MFHELFESKNELSGLTYVMHMDRQSINVGLHNLSLIFPIHKKFSQNFFFPQPCIYSYFQSLGFLSA